MAFTTDEDITNYALTLVGITRYVDNISAPDTAEEYVAQKLYDQVRRMTLEYVQPDFAVTRAALTKDTTIDNNEWVYAYDLPTDLLKPIRLENTAFKPPNVDERYKFVIEWDSSAGKRVLLADVQGAVLVYVKDASTISEFTPRFIEAFAWNLAAGIARGLGVDQATQQKAEIMAMHALSVARAEEKNRQDVPQYETPPWIRVRG